MILGGRMALAAALAIAVPMTAAAQDPRAKPGAAPHAAPARPAAPAARPARHRWHPALRRRWHRAPRRTLRLRATRHRKSQAASCKTAAPQMSATPHRAPVGAERAEAKFCGPATPPGACCGQPQRFNNSSGMFSKSATSSEQQLRGRTPASARAGRAGKANAPSAQARTNAPNAQAKTKSADAAAAATQYAAKQFAG